MPRISRLRVKGPKRPGTAYLLAALLAVAVPVAAAMPIFRLQAIQQFHYDVGNDLWQYDRRVMACTYCHVQEQGGAPWNTFGMALKAQFVKDAASGHKNMFPQVLYDLLKAGQDSDGDGYPDVLEVFAHTLPGDPRSKPGKPLAELKREFDAAGGLAQYAPIAKNKAESVPQDSGEP